MEIGNIIEGHVIDFTHEGKGLLKHDNLVIFVEGALIGDKVKMRIDKVKKNYAIGSLMEIIKPSRDRVPLDFELRESGGAIPLIEYSYQKQLQWKKDKIKNDLGKIAGLINVPINDTLGMDTPYRYRNHVQIPVGKIKGKTAVGFYEANSSEIVDMEGTILLPEIGNRVLELIRVWIDKFGIEPYNKRTKTGVLRHIGIRINRDNQLMVILVTGSTNIPKVSELIDLLKDENVISLYQNINKSNTSITYGRKYVKLYGQDSLVDYLGDYKFNISPNSFFQVNRSQTEILYNKAVEYLELAEEDIVYDLYCGIGSISLFIANRAKKVYGIETVQEAIEDAKKNAKLNDIDNVEFIVGKTEEVFPRMTKEGITANKIVLDPPRKGSDQDTLEAIVKLNPERIVYVSCNPSTMARDVKYLVGNGYRVMEVQPVDMFPHTPHVETVVLMSRVDGK